MLLLTQICTIAASLALVGIALVAIYLMLQTRALIVNANRSLAELPSLLAETRRTAATVEELLVAFTHITRSVRVAVSQFETLATRTSDITTTLLDEVERPVSHAVGVIRGIQAGARHLIQRWRARAGAHSNTNGGVNHGGEQRWLDDGGNPGGSARRGRTGTDVRTTIR